MQPAVRATVLLADVAQAARKALHSQLKHNYQHDTQLTPEKHDSLVAEIPKKIG
jgi:hypothetical protein